MCQILSVCECVFGRANRLFFYLLDRSVTNIFSHYSYAAYDSGILCAADNWNAMLRDIPGIRDRQLG